MSMQDDPLMLARGLPLLNCGSDGPYDACNLGPLPGESRPAYLARLRARFVTTPIPGTYAGRPRQPTVLRRSTVDWDRILAEIAEGRA